MHCKMSNITESKIGKLSSNSKLACYSLLHKYPWEKLESIFSSPRYELNSRVNCLEWKPVYDKDYYEFKTMEKGMGKQ